MNKKFIKGDYVKHKMFGRGKIIDVKDRTYVIKFDRFPTERDLSFNAPLEFIDNNENGDDID